ncbi:MAG: hypothetical protein KBS95_02235 [Alistipes sp.]|nr:hypothetical protein [Candidatus Alistipes equi]
MQKIVQKIVLVCLLFFLLVSCTRDEKFEADVFFTIDVQVDGTVAHTQIIPAAPDVCYFYDLFSEEAQKMYSDDFETAVQLYLDNLYSLYLSLGCDYPTASSYVASYGVSSYDFECSKYTDYTLFACAVNPSNGTICSTIATHKFSTEGVKRSSNNISFTIDNISSHGANFQVHTTNTDPYYVGVYRTEDLQGRNEENILEFVLEHDGPGALLSWIRHGDYAFQKDTFSSSTSYSIIAFGYVSQELTTNIFRQDFTTSTPMSAISVTMTPYYSGDELYEIDSVRYEKCLGRAVVPVKANVQGEYEHYYYNIYKYSKGFEDAEKLPDSSVIETLLNRSKNTQVDVPEALMTIEWDTDVIVFAVSLSADGEFGEVFRQRFTPHKSEVSPIQEFLEKYGSFLKSSSDSVSCLELFGGS